MLNIKAILPDPAAVGPRFLMPAVIQEPEEKNHDLPYMPHHVNA